MDEYQEPPLDDYLRQIIFVVSQPTDLSRTDPEGVEEPSGISPLLRFTSTRSASVGLVAGSALSVTAA
jgi:hypothetical protein